MTTYIASFDIGKKNFSFCVECVDIEKLKGIIVPCDNRYNANGTPTTEMEECLNQVVGMGNIKLHKNVDITEGCDKNKKLDPKSFYNLNKVLDEFEEVWKKCSLVIIEKQMSFRLKINVMALKIGQHVFSYFTIKYPSVKVEEFEAFHKTQILGAPMVEGKPYKNGNVRFKSMEQRDRKKWAVVEFLKILEKRGSDVKELKKIKKLDDLADSFLQLQSAKFLYYVDGN
jgi:hypothetical protein